jgi:putative transposon-encoded protein
MADKEKKEQNRENQAISQTKVKFEVYGEEMIEKEVKSSGNSGRIYLPPNWVGHIVKIIKVE